MKTFKFVIFITPVMLFPVVAFALHSNQHTPDASASCYEIFTKGNKFSDLLNYFTCMINQSVIPLIFSLALVMFVWGVVQFVINNDEEAKKAKGKQFMIWGILALTVMVSVWGLVGIVGSSFGVLNVIPQVSPR